MKQDTCLIHFRGGDYVGKGQFLPKGYYDDATTLMLKLFPGIKFVVVTDDVPLAKVTFPTYEVLGMDVFRCFTLVNKAKYLIIANSTFSWWAAWLNRKAHLILAPKYWFAYNGGSHWVPQDSKTVGFTYI